MFDPMKPRHQLSRTPPRSRKCADEKSPEINDTIQSYSHDWPIGEMTITSSSIQGITIVVC